MIRSTPTLYHSTALIMKIPLHRRESPAELRVPNSLTAETLDKSDLNEKIEYYDSVKSLSQSW